MFYAETYSNKDASNMDCIVYNDITVDQIANDILETVKNWDYAVVSNEDDDIICTINKIENKYEIIWE